MEATAPPPRIVLPPAPRLPPSALPPRNALPCEAVLARVRTPADLVALAQQVSEAVFVVFVAGTGIHVRPKGLPGNRFHV